MLLGKPFASARGEKRYQKEYNLAQASDFFNKLGVSERLKNLLLAVIGDGEELAYQTEVIKAGEDAETNMQELATSVMQQFYSSELVTDEQTKGFIEMCRILQICDGGAYTSMAVTRRDGIGYFRNAPSFNISFVQPGGFGRRSLRLRGDREHTAELDQTPRIIEHQSQPTIPRIDLV